MALGQRQSLAAQTLSIAAGATGEFKFLVDTKSRMVKRIKLWSDVAATDSLIDPLVTVRIQAEGEYLYSGLAMPVVALFQPLHHSANGPATTDNTGLFVLEFDSPLEFSRDYVLTVEIVNGEGTTIAVYCIVEGVD